MLVMVLSTSYLTSQQSYKLLNTFRPAVSEQEAKRAGILLHMAALDPLDYWQDVLPVLEATVQRDVHELARTAGKLNLANATNRHAQLPCPATMQNLFQHCCCHTICR